MIEKLSAEAARQAIPVGERVRLQSPGGNGSLAMAGVVAGWSGKSMLVTLAAASPTSGQPPLRPGQDVEIVAQRLDGIYHLHGKVQKLNCTRMPAAHPENQAAIGIHFDLARRVQERMFYRLTGSWSGVICIRQPDCEQDIAACLHRGQVWNLSGGGALLEDFDRVLSEGVRFTLFLEIDDGGAPMRLESRIVRRDQSSAIGSLLWGVRFVNIHQEDEARILRHMHAKIRERFHAEAGRFAT
jgi:c-di-GMP-binding flagellar brake protein YcgR